MWAGVQLLLFLIVTGTGLYFAAKVIYARYSYIRLGQPASVPYTIKERLKAFAAEIFGQTKLLKDRKSGWMHVIIFYGFLIVQLGAIDLIYKGIAGKPLPIPGYSVFFRCCRKRRSFLSCSPRAMPDTEGMSSESNGLSGAGTEYRHLFHFLSDAFRYVVSSFGARYAAAC